MEKTSEPVTGTDHQDKFKFVYFVFYFVGVTILFPYSMLLSVTDFWNYKFRNTSLPFNNTGAAELTDLQKNFPALVSISGNVPLTILVVLTALLGHKVGIKNRLVFTSLGMIVTFAVITLLSGLNTDSWQFSLYVTVLVLNTLYSSFNAVFQASFLGNIGRFPPRYIGSANDGMGLGGTLPAAINILIIAMESPQETVGVACISVSLLVLIAMIILYLFSARTMFYKHHAGTEEVQQTNYGLKEYKTVVANSWVYCLVIFLVYGTTLTLYPAVAALVKPVSVEETTWNTKYFLPVCCFLLETGVDWIGRSTATYTQWPKPGRGAELMLVLGSLARMVFVPLIMFCNVSPNNRKTTILFKSDWVYVLLMSVFSFTGGFIGNAGLMLGPKKVGLHLQEAAGTLLIASLVFGLGVGSLIGPYLVYLL